MTLPWMAERIQLRAIASLRPHAGNARVHDAAQLAQIMASMQAFGFTNPLLVDEAGVLIAGHGRLAAAEALAYIWHAGVHARTVIESLEAAGFVVRSQIVWAKPRLV
ncbi:MAG: ParB N-terminal domain-containing protein, partial [Alphaproteobacteria bacterium]